MDRTAGVVPVHYGDLRRGLRQRVHQPELTNREVAAWRQARDTEQTRARPSQQKDQAQVDSKTNYVVRKRAFYWR